MMVGPSDVSSVQGGVRREEEESDEALVARCRAGDPSAFEALFERHHARLFRLAYQFLRDRESALDAVQEAFIRAYRNLDGWTGQGSFAGWLARITANLAVDGIRRRRRSERHELAGEETGVVEIVAVQHGPDASAEGGELRAQLERALDRLSPMQRIVLVMKEIEGLSCEEIAAALRCSVGTVMSRLHYSRRKMQRSLRRWR
jgi:RNA polymerase sigma-70 factor (ECF subfamily)